MTTQSQVIDTGKGLGWAKWLILTLPVAVIAFLASPMGPLGTFWRPSSEIAVPTGTQLLLFLILNIAEVLIFGIGVSFLILGYPVVERVLPHSKGLAFAAYLSIGWLLVNWWPHNSLHMANGLHLGGLLAIDYAFHSTLMIAGAILAAFFFAVARQRTTVSK